MTAPLIIPIELQLTLRAPEVMASVERALAPRFLAQEPEPSATDSKAPPAIGQPWPGIDGVYVGISRGENGEPDAHLVLLNAQPTERMDWKTAMAWAQAQGEGARAPTRRESALIYANVPDHVRADAWHWTSTQYDASGAWTQRFNVGDQVAYDLYYEAWCRPLRRLPL